MKRLFKRMTLMCDDAYFVIRSSVILTGVLLFCCLLLMLSVGRFSPDTYNIYRLAEELLRLPQAVLFIAAIGSVILEERFTKEEPNRAHQLKNILQQQQYLHNFSQQQP